MSEQQRQPTSGKEPKEPMIGQEHRPTPIDFNASLSTLTVSDYLALSWGEWLKVEKEIAKELHKPEKELHKPEKEFHKPEKEFHKPETHKPEWVKGEQIKVEKEAIKELVKPEGLKGEKEFKPDPSLDRLVDQVAVRVVDILRQQGVIK